MQHNLQQLQQHCGISPLPLRFKIKNRGSLRPHQPSKAFSSCRQVVRCSNSDSRKQQSSTAPAHTIASMLLAASLTLGNMFATDSALAKPNNPLKKSDPYEDLQKIINSRGGSSSNSLLENFQKSAKEAAKVPAEILKPPTQPSAPAPIVPLPITKALPRPTSKAAAASKNGGSTGLLAGVGALVVAAGFAFTRSAGGKSAAPKPNKIKAKIKGGTKQASKQAGKQASKPSFSLPSLGGKAKQASKQANKQAPKATFSLPSLGGKAEQVGKTAKVKAGSAPQKAKKAASSGASFFGTGSTRGKSSAPAKGGGLLGTRSTKPGTQSTKAGTRSTRPGGTQKVKVTPAKSVTAAKKAVGSGGKSLVDEDTSTTVGALGVVGLAVAVGGLTLSSITSSIGGGGGAGGGSAKAPEPVKQLLDRVPEPLPVGKKAQQAATQVTSKAQEAVPQSAPSLKGPSPPSVSPPSIPNPKDIQPPPVPSPKDTLPPVAQTPQTPSGPDLVPELMQKPKTGAPLAPPPSDATKPKIPSGPDLRVPGPPSPSLGATPQLANAPSKAASKVSEAVPQVADAPSPSKAADKATKKVAEAAPQPAQAAASGPSVGSPAALLGLAAVVVGAVLFAKRTQPETDSKSSSGGGQSSGKAASASSGGQAPQSADEAAADAKKRAKQAREWIDDWKSKQ